MCYLCEEVPTILANNVWMCAMKYQVRSKRKNYYSSSANNDELYYETRSHHWDLTRLGMMIVVCRDKKNCTNWLDDTFGDSPEGNLKVSIDENNASLAVRINLPSSSSSSIWLKINKFTICDVLNSFLQLSFFLSLYPGLLLWTSVPIKNGHSINKLKQRGGTERNR